MEERLTVDCDKATEVMDRHDRENAAKAPPAKVCNAPPRMNGKTFARFDHTVAGVRGYLESKGVVIKGENGDMLYLERCIIDSTCESANATDIAVGVGSEGKITYHNQHNRGAGLQWADVREALEPGYKAWAESVKNKPAGYQHSSSADVAGDVGEAEPSFPVPVSAGQLVADFPELKAVIVEGVLRETETLNIVAAAKSHKTFLALCLALCIALGRRWLGREVKAGRVLYIDCELHPQTFAKRLAAVASAMGIMSSEFAERLSVLSLRGRLTNINSLGGFFRTLERGEYAVIVLDALYRLFPDKHDENSNADMTRIYNTIDNYAEATGAAFVVVHHASKGNQSGKAVTDVGSGAGSQSRAADSHLVFRPHEAEGAIVLEGAVRSFPPLAPTCLRWTYPTWAVAADLDPTKLKQPASRPRKAAAPAEPPEPPPPEWTTERFAAEFVTDEPVDQKAIIAKATRAGIGRRQTTDLIAEAAFDGVIHRWSFAKSREVYFANRPQPVTEIQNAPQS